LSFDPNKLNNKHYFETVYEAQLLKIINDPHFTKNSLIVSFDGFEFRPITFPFSDNRFVFFYYTSLIQHKLLIMP